MTEPGTSLRGKTVPSQLPSLTSDLMWSAGMKSYTGRNRDLPWVEGGDKWQSPLSLSAGSCCGPGPSLALSCTLTPPLSLLATKCSWKARYGGKAWGSSSFRSCSSWPTGKGCCTAREEAPDRGLSWRKGASGPCQKAGPAWLWLQVRGQMEQTPDTGALGPTCSGGRVSVPRCPRPLQAGGGRERRPDLSLCSVLFC